MKWEESRALTPLKREFLETFFEKNDLFYLTGGSALGIFYLDHRLSFDLDFFTTEEVNWQLVETAVRSVAKEIGAQYRSITASPYFHRFELTRDDAREILDFVLEMAPQVDAEKETYGAIRVDTLREIMACKICTLISRCEVKDLVDLYFLDKRGMKVVDHFDDARKKEGGLDPAMISFLLAQVQINEVPEYVLEPLKLTDLQQFVKELQVTLAGMSFPGEE